MSTVDPDVVARRALASLQAEGPAPAPADLAARAAAHALAQPRRPKGLLDDVVASVLALARPAAAFACGTALVLGAITLRASSDTAASGTASFAGAGALARLELIDADDVVAATLPFSLPGVGGSR